MSGTAAEEPLPRIKSLRGREGSTGMPIGLETFRKGGGRRARKGALRV